MRVYYLITAGLNLAAAATFWESINISALSAVPLILAGLMIFQSYLFKSLKVENRYRTNYGSDLTAEEENDRGEIMSRVILIFTPWMIPFIIFFPAVIKLLSVLIYLLGLICGVMLHRSKIKETVTERLKRESKERSDQEKKEELGFIK